MAIPVSVAKVLRALDGIEDEEWALIDLIVADCDGASRQLAELQSYKRALYATLRIRAISAREADNFRPPSPLGPGKTGGG